MLNQVALTGRLTKDIELKKTESGKSVVNFSVAINDPFDKSEENVDYISCVAWNQPADFINQYLKKGSLVAINGKLQTRSYEASTGETRYITEVLINNIYALDKK